MALNDSTYHGRTGKVYTGTVGSDSQVGEVTNFKVSDTVDEVDVTAMGDTARQYKTGLTDSTVTIDAMFNVGDSGQGALHTALGTGSSVIVTLYHTGTTDATEDHLTGSVVITQREISTAVDDMMRVTFTARGSLTIVDGSV